MWKKHQPLNADIYSECRQTFDMKPLQKELMNLSP